MRYRRLVISGKMLVTLMTEGWGGPGVRLVKDGLPAGTRFAYAIPEPVYGVSIVIEHPSFDKLRDGDEIPRHPAPIYEHTMSTTWRRG